MGSSRKHARTWAAKASLISTTSNCSNFMPVFARSFLTAGTGPMPMIFGSTPATPQSIILASGFKFRRLASSSDARTVAEAPSVMPDEFPAVMVPVFTNTGESLAMSSKDASIRICSSESSCFVSPFFPRTATGINSSPNRFARVAAVAFCWLRSAYWSCSSRVILYKLARFFAVSPITSSDSGQ